LLVGLLGLAAGTRAGELTVGVGESINNSAANERDEAWSIEYRRVFDERFAWAVAYLNEGHKPNFKRDGIAGSVWAVVESHGWSLSAGGGLHAGFAARTDGNTHINQHRLNGLVGATVGRRFTTASLRLSWQRILTSNNTDSDNLLLGVGIPID
jgi:hypothetical protein